MTPDQRAKLIKLRSLVEKDKAEQRQHLDDAWEFAACAFDVPGENTNYVPQAAIELAKLLTAGEWASLQAMAQGPFDNAMEEAAIMLLATAYDPNCSPELLTPYANLLCENSIDDRMELLPLIREKLESAEPETAKRGKRRTPEQWEELFEEYESDSGDNPALTETDFANSKGILPNTLIAGFCRVRKKIVKRTERIRAESARNAANRSLD